jgi:hypothetical protein
LNELWREVGSCKGWKKSRRRRNYRKFWRTKSIGIFLEYPEKTDRLGAAAAAGFFPWPRFYFCSALRGNINARLTV